MFAFFQRRLSLRRLLPGGVDVHCHLLPGVDDGAADMAAALEIVRTQQALGLRGAICTPHIMARYRDNTPANLRAHFAELCREISAQAPQGSPFQLYLAAEYMLDEAFPHLLEQPEQLLTIPAHLITGGASTGSGGNSERKTAAGAAQADRQGAEADFILVELPQYLLPEGWLDVVDRIRACGLRPLLAHPERYLRTLSEHDLHDLHAAGLRYQGNLGSLAGIYGPQVQRLARRLHKARLYTTYGTDAHSAGMITKMELCA